MYVLISSRMNRISVIRFQIFITKRDFFETFFLYFWVKKTIPIIYRNELIFATLYLSENAQQKKIFCI